MMDAGLEEGIVHVLCVQVPLGRRQSVSMVSGRLFLHVDWTRTDVGKGQRAHRLEGVELDVVSSLLGN